MATQNGMDAKLQQILRNYGDDVQSMPDEIAAYYLAAREIAA